MSTARPRAFTALTFIRCKVAPAAGVKLASPAALSSTAKKPRLLIRPSPSFPPAGRLPVQRLRTQEVRGRFKGSSKSVDASEAEAAYALFVPAQVMRDLVAHGPRDLCPQQLRVMAEVPRQRVLVDHDAVGVPVTSGGPAEVVRVGAGLGAPVGDDQRGVIERPLELIGQIVERLDHELVELTRRILGRRHLRQRLAALDAPPHRKSA